MCVDMCIDLCTDLCTGMHIDTCEGPAAPDAGHDILVVALGSIYLAYIIIARTLPPGLDRYGTELSPNRRGHNYLLKTITI